MRTDRYIYLVLVLGTLLGQTLPSTHAIAPTPTQLFTPTTNLRPLKVHMDTRTLWSNGQYTPSQMAAAAKAAGYDAIFFADNALDFAGSETLMDPGFEDVGPAGNFTYWNTATSGPMNTIAYSGPFRLPPQPTNRNYTQQSAYLYSALRVRSGNYSLHLELQSTARNITEYGYATASPIFPTGYNFSQPTTGIPTRPLLASNLNFSAYAYFDSLGIPPKGKHAPFQLPLSNPGDNGRFFVRFTFVNPSGAGPYSGEQLTVTLIWSAQPVNSYLLNTLDRRALNETDPNQKVVFFNPPPLETWVPVNVNVTDLALHLWNETIVNQWRLGSIQLGARSSYGALVSVYIGDATLSTSSSWNPISYFKNVIQPSLANQSLSTNPAYSVDPEYFQPSMYVYNTTYLAQNQSYNLTDDAVWKALSGRVSANFGVVALGVVSPELRDYITLHNAFGVRLIDGTTYNGLSVAGNLLASGANVVFIATPEAIRPADYNSTDTWSMRVYANSNSERDILNAISQGRAYLAVSNFTGTFSFDPYNFPITSALPIYVPIDENITLPIQFTQATAHTGSGLVRIYQNGRIDQKIAYVQNASINFSDFLRTQQSNFFIAVSDPINDSLLIVTDPIEFRQTSLIPDGALFIDNSEWTLQSSQWTSLAAEQTYQATLQGPYETEATVYIYSPTFAPNAKDPTQLARWISIANQKANLASVYDTATSTFIIHLKSTGQPVTITINFNIPYGTYLNSIFSSVVTLYLITILPFALAIVFIRRPRRAKRKFQELSR